MDFSIITWYMRVSPINSTLQTHSRLFSFVCKSLWLAFYFNTPLTDCTMHVRNGLKRLFPPSVSLQGTKQKINESLSREVTNILGKLTYIRCWKKTPAHQQSRSNKDKERGLTGSLLSFREVIAGFHIDNIMEQIPLSITLLKSKVTLLTPVKSLWIYTGRREVNIYFDLIAVFILSSTLKCLQYFLSYKYSPHF